MHFPYAYIRLAGEYAQEYRHRLQLDFLPIVSPLPEAVDADEYGQMICVDIDSSRLTQAQVARLVDWVWLNGDDNDRTNVERDVRLNKVCYVLNREGDDSEIILHDPNALG